ASQIGSRLSFSGDQSRGISAHLRRRRLPPVLSTTPASTKPPTLVPLALDKTSASPYFPVAQPCCSNQARQNWVSWSKSSSPIKRLINCRALRTVIDEPSASSTALYLLNTSMPGPIMAWDKSTGATGELMPPRVMSSRASGRVALSSRIKSRRETVGASAARERQTSTILEARALVPLPIKRPAPSVRIGQVPVRVKPALSTAARKVSQPVLEVPASPLVSACLKA